MKPFLQFVWKSISPTVYKSIGLILFGLASAVTQYYTEFLNTPMNVIGLRPRVEKVAP